MDLPSDGRKIEYAVRHCCCCGWWKQIVQLALCYLLLAVTSWWWAVCPQKMRVIVGDYYSPACDAGGGGGSAGKGGETRWTTSAGRLDCGNWWLTSVLQSCTRAASKFLCVQERESRRKRSTAQQPQQKQQSLKSEGEKECQQKQNRKSSNLRNQVKRSLVDQSWSFAEREIKSSITFDSVVDPDVVRVPTRALK